MAKVLRIKDMDKRTLPVNPIFWEKLKKISNETGLKMYVVINQIIEKGLKDGNK